MAATQDFNEHLAKLFKLAHKFKKDESKVDFDVDMLNMLDSDGLWNYIKLNNDHHVPELDQLLHVLDPLLETDFDTVEKLDETQEDNSTVEEEDDSSDDSDSNSEVLESKKKIFQPGYLDVAAESDDDDLESQASSNTLDDDFFKVSEFEKFAEALEEAEMNQDELRKLYRTERLKDTEDDEEETDDIFDEFDESDEDQEGANYTYADFFASSKRSKKEKENIERDDDDDYYEADLEEPKTSPIESSNPIPPTEPPSNLTNLNSTMTDHEKKQEELRTRLNQLHEQNLKEKSWNMRGETRAHERPENALLEQGDMEVAYVSNGAPVITEELTAEFESIIKNRICTRDYDDVQRRYSRAQMQTKSGSGNVDDENDLEKRLGQKSAQGLGSLYERDYEENVLNRVSKEDEKTERTKSEIKDMFAKVMYNLESLTSFYFVPKPVENLNQEQEKKKTTSALELEDQLPVVMSTEDGKTPEELNVASKISSKVKGIVKTDEEKTSNDRKKERREKKRIKRKLRAIEHKHNQVLKKLNPGLGNKHAKTNLQQKLTDPDVPADFSNSSKFFAKLQKQAEADEKR